MILSDRFTDAAGCALTGAAIHAIGRGYDRLDTDLLLLGLAEAGEPTPGVRHVNAAAVRGQIRQPRLPDSELLATFGIDLAEVTRRLYDSIGMRPQDPRLWTLKRSRLRPLRMTISGPAGSLVLTGQSRKVVEVASWAAGRSRRIAGDDLLRGLIADATNRSVRILRRIGVDPRTLNENLG